MARASTLPNSNPRRIGISPRMQWISAGESMRPHVAALMLLLAAALRRIAGADASRHYSVPDDRQRTRPGVAFGQCDFPGSRPVIIWIATDRAASVRRLRVPRVRPQRRCERVAARRRHHRPSLEDADGVCGSAPPAHGLTAIDATRGKRSSACRSARRSPRDLAEVSALLFDPSAAFGSAPHAGIELMDAATAHDRRELFAFAGEAHRPRVRGFALRGEDGTLWCATLAGVFQLRAHGDALERAAARC